MVSRRRRAAQEKGRNGTDWVMSGAPLAMFATAKVAMKVLALVIMVPEQTAQGTNAQAGKEGMISP